MNEQPITDEMVERAALALWRVRQSYQYEWLIPATKEDLRTYARAALEAALATSSHA
jgi:hypothetical protein